MRQALGVTLVEMEESFLRIQSVVRWSREGRASHEAEREALVFNVFFFPVVTDVRCRQEIISREETRILFSFRNFRVHFHYVCGAVVPCDAFSFVPCIVVQTYSISNDKYPTWIRMHT